MVRATPLGTALLASPVPVTPDGASHLLPSSSCPQPVLHPCVFLRVGPAICLLTSWIRLTKGGRSVGGLPPEILPHTLEPLPTSPSDCTRWVSASLALYGNSCACVLVLTPLKCIAYFISHPTPHQPRVNFLKVGTESQSKLCVF